MVRDDRENDCQRQVSVRCVESGDKSTYYMACFQVKPRSELTAEAMLVIRSMTACTKRRGQVYPPEHQAQKPE
jgi:hypothetical protein